MFSYNVYNIKLHTTLGGTYKMSDNLSDNQCEACHVDATRLTQEECDHYLSSLSGWEVYNDNNILKLKKKFTFKNYRQAWQFVDTISTLAEEAFHHPTLILSWGKVNVCWWSHSIKGLHKNDFIMAKKTENAFIEKDQ